MFDTLGDDVVDMIVIQCIVDGLAFSPVADELAVLEDPQLMGDSRLIHVQKLSYLIDASFRIDQTVQDPDPGRVCKVLEQFGDIEQDILFILFHKFFTLMALMALITAMTMTPTSAKTAIHIWASPKALSISTSTLTPIANQMFS